MRFLRKFHSKITFWFIIILLGTIGVLSFSFNYIILRKLDERMKREIQSEIEILESGLRAINQKNIDQYIQSTSLLAKKLNYTILFLDEKKNIIYKFPLEPIEEEFNLTRFVKLEEKKIGRFTFETIKNQDNDENFHRITKIITKSVDITPEKKLKYITFITSLEPFYSFASSIRFQIIFYGSLLFIVGLILIKYISRQVTEPINHIINFLEEYQRTGEKKKLTIKQTTEFNFLANSINKLIEQIDHDLNELKKLERYRTEFLGNVSHELRTPIFSIQSFLETLLAGGIDDPNINKVYLQRALKNLDRLNRLLNDLINISQIEAKQLRMSFRYFNIDELIQRVLEDLKVLADQKNISLEFTRIENFNRLVFGDRERIYQVMYNLIENAIRHNPEGINVKIYYKTLNSLLRIFVQDNGTGIPEEDLPRIFERFYRVNKERSRESGGTGLGLAIAKHIIEAHNSKIFVESKINEGTTFYFDLKCN